MSVPPPAPNVAKAGAIMIVSIFLSRVLGLIRDMVITGQFGMTELTDAYFASFQVPDLLFYLIAGGALSSAFIPVFSEYLHTGREDEAWHVFSVVVTVMSVVVLVFIALAWVFAEQLITLTAPGLPPDVVPIAAAMSRIVVPAQYAFFIGGVMLGTLYARQVFSVPGLSPNIYNLGIIFGALVISQLVVPGVIGMSWGALVGAYIGNIFLPLIFIRKLGGQFRPSFDLKHEGVRKVLRLMAPVVFGLSLPGVFAMILRAFGSFYGNGVVSSLEIANRLMQAPLGVFGQSLALAVFPALAQFYAQGNMGMFRAQLSNTLRTSLFLSVPVAAMFVAMPVLVVESLYGRGALDPTDIQRTATALRMFGIGIAAWCIQPALMRAYFALQRTWPPVLLGTLTTLVFGGTAWALVAGGAGFESLPLAASIAAFFLAGLMLIAVSREVEGLDVGGVALTFGKSVVAALPAVAVAMGLMRLAAIYWPNLSTFGMLVSLVPALLIAAWAYYFAAKLMQMPEIAYLDRAAARLKRR